MLVNTNDFIYRNGEYFPVERVTYGDFISDTVTHTNLEVTTINNIKRSFNVKTDLKTFYFHGRDEVLTTEGPRRVDELTAGDYIVLPFHFGNPLPLKTFKITPYLVERKYDISSISEELCSDIGVTPTFLKKALTTGVPDQEYFNTNFEKYLRSRGYSDSEDYCQDFLKDHLRTLKPNLPINVNFLRLATRVLTNRFILSGNYVTLTEQVDENIVKYLTDIGINFTIKDNQIVCNSQLMVKLFENNFDSFSFVNYLTPKSIQYMISFFEEERFITGSYKTLKILQDFYFSLGIIASIECFNEDSYILSAVSNYIRKDETIYLPVLEIKQEDNLLVEIL